MTKKKREEETGIAIRDKQFSLKRVIFILRNIFNYEILKEKNLHKYLN